MDYKYIEQLLDSYWNGETSLEEENILRTFFSQDNIPGNLLKYQDLFVYEREEVKLDVLDDNFAAKVMSSVEKPVVKAHVIGISQRLMPLFKAVAVVAIIIAIGNAAQVPYKNSEASSQGTVDGFDKVQRGASVAMNDSSAIDTVRQNSRTPAQSATILK